ncbi:MAG: hypothetical protein HQL85_13615 [Magnetococcales bacterium]|nr:hypothetical protein [Magnetococcales bacterium]MBF0174122.1 hypothetical protein [Magnetococcales bacterium]MBF0632005.1 hypothetical protein [Magnetococcales bacterium]
MSDYSLYIHAVYLLALLVYGGVTILWKIRIKTIETRIQHYQGLTPDGPTHSDPHHP